MHPAGQEPSFILVQTASEDGAALLERNFVSDGSAAGSTDPIVGAKQAAPGSYSNDDLVSAGWEANMLDASKSVIVGMYGVSTTTPDAVLTVFTKMALFIFDG